MKKKNSTFSEQVQNPIGETWREAKLIPLTHRCQPLRFFRNCYEFRAKITVLRSTVYLLRMSDYCRPETAPHLNIIVII